ncbi:MAG: hypothetical protein ABR530_06605, partial [Pyrinomonadaceae bacterium]
MTKARPAEIGAFFLLIILYVGIRLYGLTSTCLWFDEIFGVHAAEHSWDQIIPFISLDLIHPPLFYVLLKLWISLGGEGLLWLRIFSVLFASATVAPFLGICAELRLHRRIQAMALLLLAVNGQLIKYAQEVRMYSLLLFLSLLSIWLFFRYLRGRSGTVPLLIVNTLLVYTHYFGWLV